MHTSEHFLLVRRKLVGFRLGKAILGWFWTQYNSMARSLMELKLRNGAMWYQRWILGMAMRSIIAHPMI